jgi:hypothetical protein
VLLYVAKPVTAQRLPMENNGKNISTLPGFFIRDAKIMMQTHQ